MSSDPIEVLRRMRNEWPLATDEGPALESALASLSAPKPESAEAVWTDEQCLQFAAVAFRHAPKNLPDGVTLEDIRMAASTVYGLTAPPRPEASDEDCPKCRRRGDDCGEHWPPDSTAPQQASAPVGVEGWAVTKLRPHEARCEACGRAVWDGKDRANCVGFLAPCGKRVARRGDCGTVDCLEALAQQPAAVDGASFTAEEVEEAMSVLRGRHGSTALHDEVLADMERVLTAALAGQQQGGTPE